MNNDTHEGFCATCKKTVTFHYEPLNHKSELIKTVLTAGLWLPIWLFLAVARPKICDVCGQAFQAE